tara:strand:+ start:2732 stop:3328 length:597 start_codon:yes stop_codon:yes gene_type:complete
MLSKDYIQFRKALQSLGRKITTQAKKNLKKRRGKKKSVNATGQLSRSIKYRTYVGDKGIDLNVLMDKYGSFIDLGVKGASPEEMYKNNDQREGKQQAPFSPFSYKDKRPPMKDLKQWAKKRNIRLRDKDGKYKKGNYTTIAFILQNSIYHQGIAPTLFFTRAFRYAYKGFGKLIGEAIGKDIGAFIKKENKNKKNIKI